MKDYSSTPVHFRGKPGRLSTVLRLTDRTKPASSAVCIVDLPGIEVRGATLRELRDTEPGLSVLKIKLPRSTPPGEYKGTVQVAGDTFPIAIDVEPRTRIRLFPRNFKTDATPGAVVGFPLTVLNKGNSEFQFDKEYRFCVFERGAIDRALFVALVDDKPGPDRLDRLLDELAGSHGGRVRLEVESGASAIAPGEARDVRVIIRLSDRLRPGRSYTGAWKIENTSLNLEINVSGDKETSK